MHLCWGVHMLSVLSTSLEFIPEYSPNLKQSLFANEGWDSEEGKDVFPLGHTRKATVAA